MVRTIVKSLVDICKHTYYFMPCRDQIVWSVHDYCIHDQLPLENNSRPR